MRDRLIELLLNKSCRNNECPEVQCDECDCIPVAIGDADKIADYLLANGVIVPPCKVGDTVYYITGIHNTIVKGAKVEEVYYGEGGFAFHLCTGYDYFTLQQEDVYITKEEAEAALKGGDEG